MIIFFKKASDVSRVLRAFFFAVFFICGATAKAQTYFGNQSVYGTQQAFPLSSGGLEFSARFIMPGPTRTLANLQVAGALLTSGSPVTYVLAVDNDNSGLPGAQIAAGQQVVFPGSFYSGGATFTMSPGIMTAGNVYHVVVSYSGGPVSPTNNYGPDYDTPNFQVIPRTQALDPSLAALTFSGGAWTTIGNALPTFIVGFTDGSYFGNPYDTYQVPLVFGTGSGAN
ncbi:MAG TPA: hypothetical protein VIJ93_00385, partial [bacterium]